MHPLSPAARRALQRVTTEWQPVPHHIRGSHLAVMLRHGHIEHRWPFDLSQRLRDGGSMPWLRDGEIRRVVSLLTTPRVVRLTRDYLDLRVGLAYPAGTVLHRKDDTGQYITEGTKLGQLCVATFSLIRDHCEVLEDRWWVCSS